MTFISRGLLVVCWSWGEPKKAPTLPPTQNVYKSLDTYSEALTGISRVYPGKIWFSEIDDMYTVEDIANARRKTKVTRENFDEFIKCRIR